MITEAGKKKYTREPIAAHLFVYVPIFVCKNTLDNVMPGQFLAPYIVWYHLTIPELTMCFW
jgi:hypothetical protein